MIIDVHTHLGRLGANKEDALCFDELLRRMDEWGVDKAVILPILVSPGSSFYYFTPEQVLELHRQRPDRVIPFCNVDLQHQPDVDYSWMLAEYKEAGCLGVGEITSNIYIDDPRARHLFRQCEKVGLPVLYHASVAAGGRTYGLVDDIYLPRLESVLREFPGTVFIGHAMSFWAEISADVAEETRSGYPKGPVVRPGRLQELLRRCPNLYADLSAGSGYNAIARDPAYGLEFLDEFQDKLLFGTDLCHHNQDAPIVHLFRELRETGRLSGSAYEKIAHGNAERVLGLPAG